MEESCLTSRAGGGAESYLEKVDSRASIAKPESPFPDCCGVLQRFKNCFQFRDDGLADHRRCHGRIKLESVQASSNPIAPRCLF